MLTDRRRWTRLVAVALSITLVLTNLPARVATISQLPSDPGVALARAMAPPTAGSLPTRPVTAPRFAAGSGLEIVSLSTSGAQGTGFSVSVAAQAISDDGRFVVFSSDSNGLVTGDSTGFDDIFLRDRQTPTTILVSQRADGAPANSGSFQASISADGTRVAFFSNASDLAPGDANASSDVFVRDLTTGTTILASVSLTGGTGNASSHTARISRSGRYVVFQSDASDLVAADGNDFTDVFVRDLLTSTTTRVSVAATGGDADSFSFLPSISSDGRYVSFVSLATNIVAGSELGQNVFVRDLVAGTTFLVSVDGPGGTADQFIGTDVSADGRFVMFVAILGGGGSVADGGASPVAMAPGGVTGRPSASTFAPGIWIRDRTLATTTQVVDTAEPFDASISPDGRFVVFDDATALVQADSNSTRDIYVLDRDTGEFAFVSAGTTGGGGNELSFAGALTSDGRFAAFSSEASDLVTGDSNNAPDAFLWDRTAASGGGGTDFGEDFPWQRGAAPFAGFSFDPVNLGTGSLTIDARDLELPGRLIPLSFVRWYNASDPIPGPLGPGWTHSFNWVLTDEGSIVEIRRGDGRVDVFARNADGSYGSAPNVTDTLTKNADGSFRLTQLDQTRFDFTSGGQLSFIGEPAGNRIALTYTGSRLDSITDTVGRVVTLSYDSAGRLTRLADAGGRATTYAYDDAGRLSIVTDRFGNGTGPSADHQWRYEYDGSTRHIARVTDPDGRIVVRNTFDAEGRVIAQRNALDRETTFSYTPGQTIVTDPRGHSTTYTFDSRLRVVSQADQVGAAIYTISYTYDAAGNRTSVTDRNGQRTDYTYDARGNLLTRTDPPATPGGPRGVTTYAYDDRNNPIHITDAAGFVITIAYHATTNLMLRTTQQVSGTTGAATSYEYGDAANPGRLTRLVNPRGNVGGTPNPTFSATFVHDGSGNLIRQTDADGAVTTFSYDSFGRLVTVVDPDGNATGGVPTAHTWRMAYDELDRRTNHTDALGGVTSITYDGSGNVTTQTDRLGNVTTYGYDVAGRLSSVKQRPDPAGNPTLHYTTAVTRDANGNATRITQGNGTVSDYAYDALDRLISTTTYPTPTTPQTTTFTLDGNGWPLTRADASGATVSYAYDGLSRLRSVNAPGIATSYNYDARSHRTQMTDSTGVTTYQYDGLGRTTQVAAPGGTIRYGYDVDGNRTQLIYPGNQTATYAYSPGGRLTSVTDWAGRVTTFTYRASGATARIAYPNAVVGDFAYDADQRLVELSYRRGSVIASERYVLDPEGNPTALTDVFGSTPQVAGTASYDGLQRLVALERHVVSNGAPISNETFTLDAASNVVSRTGPTASYTYDGADRLLSDGTRAFGWDGGDRLITRGSDTFTYDALGEMTTSIVGGVTRSYRYDGDGLLRLRTEGTTTTNFLYDTTTAPATLLVAGTDKIVHGAGPLYRVHASGTYDTFIRDGLGSVRLEVSGSGSISNVYDYLAYGSVRAATGAPLLGYAGELTDPSGLVYLRARWYDPAVGRFTTAEPLAGEVGVPASLNRCLYSHARPTALTDPDGLDPKRKMCTDLSNEISPRRNLLARQAQNLREDPLQLGPVERQTHENTFRDLQGATRKLLNRWDTSGCDRITGIGIPADVRGYATQPIPAAAPRVGVSASVATTAAGAGAVAIGVYVIYRVVRFLPSLLPPLWPTLVPNALVP